MGKCGSIDLMWFYFDIWSEVGNIPVLLHDSKSYGFVMASDVGKIVEKFGLEKLEKPLYYKYSDAGEFVCLDDDTCYDLKILRKYCADIEEAYANSEKPILAPVSDGRWYILLAPYLI